MPGSNKMEGEPKSFNDRIDECIREVKPLGRYQILLFLCLQCLTICFSVNYTMLIFGALDPVVSCGNVTLTGSKDACEDLEICRKSNQTSDISLSKPQGFKTIGNTWHDVFTEGCDWRVSPAMSLIMITSTAFIVGGLASGPVSDHFGRRIPIIIGGSFGAICGLAAAFSPYFMLFSVLHISSVFFYTLGCYPAITLAFESTHSRYRVASFFAASWLFGYIFCGLLGQITKSWKLYLIFINIFGFFFTLPFVYFEDSPRWCLANSKYKSASRVFQKIAKLNGAAANMDETKLKARFSSSDSDSKSPTQLSLRHQIKAFVTYRDLWASNIIIWIFLCIMNAAANGMQFNLGMFVSSSYNLMITKGAIRLWQPGLFIFLDMKYPEFKRKIFLLVAIVLTVLPFTVGMVTGILSFYAEESRANLNAATAYLLTVANSVNFGVLYYALGMIGLELYPTTIRNIGFSSMAVAGGLGSVIGPPIFALEFGWEPMRYVLITISFLVCGVLSMMILPETKDKPLPDTVDHLHLNRIDKSDQG